MKGLQIEMKEGDWVKLGDAKITLVKPHGSRQYARLIIEAPSEVRILTSRLDGKIRESK